MIDGEKAHYPVRMMCRVLGVSRSGYYAWARRGPSQRSIEDANLVAEIRGVYDEYQGRYGSPRIHQELRERRTFVGRKRVARLMRAQGLRARAPKRFRRTTDSNHSDPIAPNLLAREFSTPGPDVAWVGDITYLWTGEGWLYLAVLIDLYSRRVVGWSMADHLRTELALGALEMALGHRDATGTIHHTDRGCQYASEAYREVLDTHGLLPSMSRRGDCWDNAPAESFFSTLKLELAYCTHWPTRQDARDEVHEYIEVFYNRSRRHSTLGYCTPVDAEVGYAQAGKRLSKERI